MPVQVRLIGCLLVNHSPCWPRAYENSLYGFFKGRTLGMPAEPGPSRIGNEDCGIFEERGTQRRGRHSPAEAGANRRLWAAACCADAPHPQAGGPRRYALDGNRAPQDPAGPSFSRWASSHRRRPVADQKSGAD